MPADYPAKKTRELSEDEKRAIRTRIQEVDQSDLDESISQNLADEFDCSPSQIAGILAQM